MFISEATNRLNLSEDDLRMSLMGVRDDWDSCNEISDSEYQLISQSVDVAALPPSTEDTDSTEIQPVADMPIEDQQVMIENLSQVMGQRIVLGVQRRVELLNAVDKLVNQAALANRDINQRELLAAYAQKDEQDKANLLQAATTLQNLIDAPKTELTAIPDNSDVDNALASITKKWNR